MRQQRQGMGLNALTSQPIISLSPEGRGPNHWDLSHVRSANTGLHWSARQEWTQPEARRSRMSRL